MADGGKIGELRTQLYATFTTGDKALNAAPAAVQDVKTTAADLATLAGPNPPHILAGALAALKEAEKAFQDAHIAMIGARELVWEYCGSLDGSTPTGRRDG
jgi:hypothetical protein